jgi:hypothetical protein
MVSIPSFSILSVIPSDNGRFGRVSQVGGIDKESFLPTLYLPLAKMALTSIYKAASAIDVAGRKRLDRRTLYQSLLLDLLYQIFHYQME